MEKRPSPNFDLRPVGQAVNLLLMHYTGMVSAKEALGRMCSAEAKVSAHYMVDEDGSVVAMVDEDKHAWHAGASYWAGERDINGCSIGIEVVNPGHEFGYRAFPEPQIDAVIALSQEILTRHDIPAKRVLGHSDVAPERKEDPGELFPWARLAEAGIGRFIDPETVPSGPDLPPDELQKRFKKLGYGIEITGRIDEATTAVIRAFQRHYRSAQVDGIADGQTLGLLEAYLTGAP
jgi:N-acetylmuramoyl-L-alanine amidase